jgi:Cof subfamily protein (haloacid dehalogenase superfamily)
MKDELQATQPGDMAALAARRTVAPGRTSPNESPAWPRLAVFDIDGTLLDSSGAVRPAVRRAVAAIRDSGTQVMLASGRSPWGVVEVARALELSGPHVTMNGSLFSDPFSGRIEWARVLAPEIVVEGIELAREIGSRPTVNLVNGYAIQSEPDGSIPADVGEWMRSSRLHLVSSLAEVAERDPLRFYIPTGHERHQRAVELAQRRFGDRAAVVWGDEYGVELLAPGTNKGEGVRIAAESMGYSRDEVMAVGDASNDVEMLAWASHSAAMGGASVDVLAAARISVPSSDEDGVVAAIERFFPGLAITGTETDDEETAEPAA